MKKNIPIINVLTEMALKLTHTQKKQQQQQQKKKIEVMFAISQKHIKAKFPVENGDI